MIGSRDELDVRERLRAEVATFTAANTTAETIEAAWSSGTLYDPSIHRAMAEAGLIGTTWPTALGGRGLDAVAAGYLWEAMNYHRLPVDLLELTEMVAHVLVAIGTEEQKRSVLPRVRSGDLLMSLGYSEPNAGSDVAACATRAVRNGDGWVVNGSKIFTTGAHVADLIFLLARTDPDAPKHRGLSLFLVPRRSDGVEVQPIWTFGGERTNTVFLTDVELERNALVGAENDGWSVLNVALGFERQVMGAYVGQARRLYDDLLGQLGERAREPELKVPLLDARIRIESAQALAAGVGARAVAGEAVDVPAAMAKLAASEVLKDLAHLALDLVGPEGLVAPEAAGAPSFEHWFRHAQVATIYGGSNEIQRNIIASRGLGLR